LADDVLRAIRAGDVEAYVGVIRAQAKAVAAGKLPHPEGRAWNDDDAEELLSRYYESDAYLHSVVNAHDDDSLNALVHTGLANLVRADLRKSDRARLKRRIKEVMVEEGYVEDPKGFWRRPQDPGDAYGGSTPDLVAAAWSADVQVVRWRPDAKRNSPFAERASLVAVLNATFDAAGGAIHEDVLTEVFGQRLGVGPVAHTEDLDVVEERFVPDTDPGPEEALIAGEEELEAAVQALEIWGQLSLKEQSLVPHLADSAREAATALGGGKTTMNTAQTRLKEKMRVLLGDEDTERRRNVLRELLVLAGPDKS